MQKIFECLALLAAGAFLSHPSFAQHANPVESKLEARKVVRAADGKESTTPADAVRPGDLIEYTATYSNRGKQAVRNLEATLPIPANTEFVPGSVRPSGAKASLDAKAFGDMPLKRTVKRDGRDVQEDVPARAYRYLRWYPGELGGEKSVSFVARVRVIDDRPGAPSTPGAGK